MSLPGEAGIPQPVLRVHCSHSDGSVVFGRLPPRGPRVPRKIIKVWEKEALSLPKPAGSVARAEPDSERSQTPVIIIMT